MLKEIKYNGFTATPSDYECPDGDLATLINLVPEDGALQPVKHPLSLFTLPEGYSVFFIHEGSGYKHFIIRNEQSLYWIDEPEQGTTLAASSFTTSNRLKTYDSGIDIYDVKAIGNTLVVLASDSLHYFLWKDNSYNYLGSHLPELPISFGLQGTREESSEAFTVSFNESVSWSQSIVSNNFSDDLKSSVTSQVLAKVNKFIADKYTNGNQFMYPFFVRYAYRLYDGSLTMHSAPILMVCANGQNPYVLGSHAKQHDDGADGTWDTQSISNCKVYGALFKLDFAVVNQSYITALQNWSDIVSSVDIFVSAPLYSFDQSGEVKGVDAIKDNEIGGKDAYCVCKATHGGTYGTYYQYHSMPAFMWYGKSTMPGYSFRLPMKGSQTQKENIVSASQFYFLKSYKLSNLSTNRSLIEVESGYFQSLVNREVMTDDYDSHSVLAAKYGFVYNARLNIAGVKRVLPKAFHMASMLPYTNGYLQKNSDGNVDRTYETQLQNIGMFVYIKENGKEIVARSEDMFDSVLTGLMPGAQFGMFTPLAFLYYPNANAYKAVIVFYRGSTICKEVQLEPHSMLNGAFFFGEWAENPGTEVQWANVNKGNSLDSSRVVDVPNKIYTSEVNDPFNFPALGINTVGTGTILGICAAVKALSQGQFGQFPLYAFTTEGVWALEVSSEGKYTARQPITRDVCTNADSITQLDNAVLFVTDRGIMLISGSNSQCISDTLDAEYGFDIDELPRLSSLTDDAVATALDAAVSFRSFLASARMLYDYTNQRIIVYNPSRQYAYVYSLKSKLWGMMQANIVSGINSYPETLALDSNNTVISLSESNQAPLTAVNGLIVTRPLKLDAPDVLKTVDTIIQRGYFRKGHVQSILYGSRDLFNWHLIYSSNDHYLRGFRGTPFKFFRIALVCNLTKEESVFGCTVQFTPRLTDQPR